MKPAAVRQEDRGFLVFENTSEVIQAENLLKQAGWAVQVMGPPPEIHSGCDLVITFPLIEELNILRLLDQNRIPPCRWCRSPVRCSNRSASTRSRTSGTI
jgi:hypothetical protein